MSHEHRLTAVFAIATVGMLGFLLAVSHKSGSSTPIKPKAAMVYHQDPQQKYFPVETWCLTIDGEQHQLDGQPVQMPRSYDRLARQCFYWTPGGIQQAMLCANTSWELEHDKCK